MTEFQVYDTTGVCRGCDREYPTKCFALRTADNPVRGFCPECKALDDERLARLKKPPRSYGKTKTAEPDPRPDTGRRQWPTKQRRWEPGD
jgi:hypothetical protein